jgi:peptidoglycan/LPS O-acetylase OafA/YrhL
MLSSRVSVFLGKISFPLYVIHMTIICSLTSFLITKEYDPNNTKLIVLYFTITVVVSIICACILYPVEKFAIAFSGKIFEYFSTDKKIKLKEFIGNATVRARDLRGKEISPGETTEPLGGTDSKVTKNTGKA